MTKRSTPPEHELEMEMQTNAVSATQDESRTMTKRSTPPEHELETSAACAAAADEPLLGRFAARLAGDNITLALVLGCLDVCSVLRCRRVSRVWHAASLKPEAWLHASLTLTTQQLLMVPAASTTALQRLCLVLSPLETSGPNLLQCQARAMLRLSLMPRLVVLRLEYMIVDTELLKELRANVPQLCTLDLRASRSALDIDGCSDAGRDGCGAYSVCGADSVVPQDAAAAEPLPVMPRLLVLYGPQSPSLRSLPWLFGQAPLLRMLGLRLNARSNDLPCVRHAVQRLYGPSLQRLAVHNAQFDASHVAALPQLAYLSLVDSVGLGFVTPALLTAVARAPSVQRVHVMLASRLSVACCTADWWSALASVAALASLDIEAPFADLIDDSASAGLAQVLAAPRSRLSRLSMRNIGLTRFFLQAATKKLPAPLRELSLLMRSLGDDDCRLLAVAVPLLESLEVAFYTGLINDGTVHSLARHLPHIQSLSLGSIYYQLGQTEPLSSDAWAQLVSMPHLASLQAWRLRHLRDCDIGAMCEQLEAAQRARDDRHACDLAVFNSRPRPPPSPEHGGRLHTLILDPSMITYDNCTTLLRASKHLRIVSPHMPWLSYGLPIDVRLSVPKGAITPRLSMVAFIHTHRSG